MITIDHELLIDIVYLITHSDEADDKELVRSVLEVFEKEVDRDDELNSDINVLLVGIINSMLHESGNITDGRAHDVLLKLQHSKQIDGDPEILESIKCIIDNTINPEKCRRIRSKLYKSITWYSYDAHVCAMISRVRKCKYTSNPAKQDELLDSVLQTARSFSPPKLAIQTTDRVDEIDFNDTDSMERAFAADSKRTASTNVLKMGLQGLNAMMGENAGICYGETMMIYGLSHHFKSGWLLKIGRWITTLNKPPKTDLKPLALFISLENEAMKNTRKWFIELYLNLFNTAPPEDFTDRDIVAFVHKEFAKNGWHFKIVRRLGDTFDYQSYLDLFEQYKQEGYEIFAVIKDYLAKMQLNNENSERGLSKLATDVVNHARYHGYAYITANQLNHTALTISSDSANIVKRFSPSCIAVCKGLEHEFDLTMYTHIEENHLGNPYLTALRGKHRYVDNTPAKDKSFAYKFNSNGIMDDYASESKAVKDIYAEYADDEKDNSTTTDLF